MASELALGITFSAAAGAAVGAFGDLKDTLQRVNTVTKDLKAKQAVLGKEVQSAAKLSSSNVGQLSAQYEKQQKAIERLKQSSMALGKVQARLPCPPTAGFLKGRLGGDGGADTGSRGGGAAVMHDSRGSRLPNQFA